MTRAVLLDLTGGDIGAVQFIEDFWGFMEAWDDIIDRDKPPDDEAINKAMLWALFGVADDPFFQRHSVVLRGAIQQAVASWLTANQFEKSGKRDLVEQAYFLRCSAYDVFATVVLLVAPNKHMAAIAYFRGLAPEDTLAKYMREHMGERHGVV